MFTGLVEAVGTVVGVREMKDARRITIETGIAPELTLGESVSVDGACLTAVEMLSSTFSVEAIGSTLSRTIAGGYHEGSRVNLERAIRVGDRLGGHFVQGHVDAVGEVESIGQAGDYWLLGLRIPADVEATTVLHGSITVNGVSLTVNALSPGRCQIALIPHTWTHTYLSSLRPGQPVNLEADLIGKHVAKLMGR
jgi:riboflavin synthase